MKASPILSLAQHSKAILTSMEMGIMQGVIQFIHYNINFLKFHFTEESEYTLLKLHNQVLYDGSFVLMNNLLNIYKESYS